MAMLKRTVHWAICDVAGCEDETADASTPALAMADARHYGWRVRGGLLLCPAHVKTWRKPKRRAADARRKAGR